jgi:hypothetical protein
MRLVSGHGRGAVIQDDAQIIGAGRPGVEQRRNAGCDRRWNRRSPPPRAAAAPIRPACRTPRPGPPANPCCARWRWCCTPWASPQSIATDIPQGEPFAVVQGQSGFDGPIGGAVRASGAKIGQALGQRKIGRRSARCPPVQENGSRKNRSQRLGQSPVAMSGSISPMPLLFCPRARLRIASPKTSDRAKRSQ